MLVIVPVKGVYQGTEKQRLEVKVDIQQLESLE
jgi:hypothetical protein